MGRTAQNWPRRSWSSGGRHWALQVRIMEASGPGIDPDDSVTGAGIDLGDSVTGADSGTCVGSCDSGAGDSVERSNTKTGEDDCNR